MRGDSNRGAMSVGPRLIVALGNTSLHSAHASHDPSPVSQSSVEFVITQREQRPIADEPSRGRVVLRILYPLATETGVYLALVDIKQNSAVLCLCSPDRVGYSEHGCVSQAESAGWPQVRRTVAFAR